MENEAVESFGEYIKRERLLRGIELEDISRVTNIKLVFLQALESNDYQKLPHVTFVRGFIRAYAKYIGLTPDEVITRFEQYMFQENKEEEPEENAENTREIPLPIQSMSVKEYLPMIGFLLLGLTILILILAGIFWSSNSSKSNVSHLPAVVEPPVPPPPVQESKPVAIHREEATPIPSSPKKPAAAPGNKPASVPVSQKESSRIGSRKAAVAKDKLQASPQPKSVVASAANDTPAATGLTLLVKANDHVWIQALPDKQESAVDVILEKGNSKVIKAQEKIVLTLGNVAGATLQFNGQDLPPLGRPGQVIRGLEFNRNTKIEDIIKKYGAKPD